MEEYGEDYMLTVVTCRGEYKSKLEKPIKEVIEKLLDHAFETKTVGFKMDW